MPTEPGWDPNTIVFEGELSKGRWKKLVRLPVDRTALVVAEGPKGGRAALTVTQQIGSLTTYMRKYLLGLMFNVITVDDLRHDDDGDEDAAATRVSG